jgi:hypothetical protein
MKEKANKTVVMDEGKGTNRKKEILKNIISSCKLRPPTMYFPESNYMITDCVVIISI